MSYVYFIKPVDADGPIKIGTSTDPKMRLSSVQSGNWHALEIIASVEATDDLERRLHRHFAKHRVRGEWFEAVPALHKVIGSILDSSFEDADIPPLPVRQIGPERPLESRIAQGLKMRVYHMERRSGYACRQPRGGYRDPAAVAKIEQYLARPAKFGVPSQWGDSAELRKQWAVESRRAAALKRWQRAKLPAPA